MYKAYFSEPPDIIDILKLSGYAGSDDALAERLNWERGGRRIRNYTAKTGAYKMAPNLYELALLLAGKHPQWKLVQR